MLGGRGSGRGFIALLVAVAAGAWFASAAGAAPRTGGRATDGPSGLWLVGDSGRIEALGGAAALELGGPWRRRRAVAAAATPSGQGLWILAADGTVVAVGDAVDLGPAPDRPSPQHATQAVGIAASPDGAGYLVAFDDGTVEAYGDAGANGGATPRHGDAHAIVAVVATPTGNGYWLVGADGAVYPFGDAASLSAKTTPGRIAAAAATPSGRGLWLVTEQGDVVSLGDAPRLPSPSRKSLHGTVVGVAASPGGAGLWLVTESGSLAAVGDATPFTAKHAGGAVVAVVSSVPTGSLTVTVSDLPSDAPALAKASGPAGTFAVSETETLRIPAGTYAVSADPVHAGSTSYYAAVSGSPVTVDPGGTATAGVDYATAIPDTTKVVPPGAVEGAAGSPTTGVTLTLDAAATPALAVGDIVALGVTPATPDGLLGTVRAISSSGGTLTVQTTPARLVDAIASGQFDFDTSRAATQARRGGATQSFGDVTQQIASSLDCGADAPVSLTGSVSVSPSIQLEAHWGGFFHPFTITSASFTGTVAETARLALSASAAAHCSLAPTPLLFAPPRAEFTFWGGPVPVVVVAPPHLPLSGSGSIAAGVETSASQTFSATAGVQYDDGLFVPVHTFSNSFDFSPPSATANASLSAQVGPQLSLLLYGVAGPEASLRAGLDFEADTSAQPWWTLWGTLDAGAGFTVPGLGLDWSDPSLLSYRQVLAQATTPPPPSGGGGGGGGDNGGGGGGGGGGGNGGPPPDLTPVLTLSPGTAAPGDTVTLTGTGFGTQEAVDLSSDLPGSGLGTAHTDAAGSFSSTARVPAETFGGLHLVVATGEKYGEGAEAELVVIPPAAPGGGGAACNLGGDSAGPGGGPANDGFSHAALLSGGAGSYTGTLVGASLQPGEAGSGTPASMASASASVWYCFVPPTSGDYSFTTAGSWVLPDAMAYNWWEGNDNPGEPPMLTVYGGSGTSIDWSTVSGGWSQGGILADPVVWNNTWDRQFNGPWDAAPAGSQEVGWTSVTVTLQAGTPYLVDVDNGDWGSGSAPGTFLLSWGPADSDADGVANSGDNCPYVWNPDQANTYHLDNPDLGDACSPPQATQNWPLLYNLLTSTAGHVEIAEYDHGAIPSDSYVKSDGTRVYFSSPLVSLAATAANPLNSGQILPGDPQVSPDGLHYVYASVAADPGGGSTYHLYAGSTDVANGATTDISAGGPDLANRTTSIYNGLLADWEGTWAGNDTYVFTRPLRQLCPQSGVQPIDVIAYDVSKAAYTLLWRSGDFGADCKQPGIGEPSAFTYSPALGLLAFAASPSIPDANGYSVAFGNRAAIYEMPVQQTTPNWVAGFPGTGTTANNPAITAADPSFSSSPTNARLVYACSGCAGGDGIYLSTSGTDAGTATGYDGHDPLRSQPQLDPNSNAIAYCDLSTQTVYVDGTAVSTPDSCHGWRTFVWAPYGSGSPGILAFLDHGSRPHSDQTFTLITKNLSTGDAVTYSGQAVSGDISWGGPRPNPFP